MLTWKKALGSSVGKKFLMAVTGFALTGFLVTHLIANLMLLKADGSSFNHYAHLLMSWGFLLYLAEAGLLVLFLLHVVTAVRVTAENRRARPHGYEVVRSKGGPSKFGVASRTLPYTGIVILAFLIFHIKTFKYGPGVADGYGVQFQNETIRDLHRLVLEKFKDTGYFVTYEVAMFLLMFHLRHGLWSAFQSLSLACPRTSRGLYFLAFVLAVLIGGGFLLIPAWIYFDGSRLWHQVF